MRLGYRRTMRVVPTPERVHRERRRGGSTPKFAVAMEVKPYGDRWEWAAWCTFDGRRGLSQYTELGWRTPAPYEIRGRCRTEATAWDRARAAADDARERYARHHVDKMRTHREDVPL